MKILLLLILSLFFFKNSHSQDSACAVLTVGVDQQTGEEVREWSQPILVGDTISKNPFSVALITAQIIQDDVLQIGFVNDKIFRVDANSEVTLLMDDNTKVRQANEYALNFKGVFAISFSNNASKNSLSKRGLQALLRKNIKAIRLSGCTVVKDIYLTDYQSQQVRSAFNCLFKVL